MTLRRYCGGIVIDVLRRRARQVRAEDQQSILFVGRSLAGGSPAGGTAYAPSSTRSLAVHVLSPSQPPRLVGQFAACS